MNTRSWRKLGRVFSADFDACHPKMISHAANPLPVVVEDGIYRIYFNCRDENNRSSVGIVDFDLIRCEIVAQYDQPVFEHGPPGSFYADGVSLGNIYRSGDSTYMLFMGWQNKVGAHWRGDIGRLILQNDFSLVLDSDTPFIASDHEDPVSLSYPWVMQTGEDGFDMWYGSTVTWEAGNGEMLHVIKHATSVDGHDWKRHGIAIPYQLGVAQAFSRPQSPVILNRGTICGFLTAAVVVKNIVSVMHSVKTSFPGDWRLKTVASMFLQTAGTQR